MSEQAIALNRFGLGARPDEAVPADPRRWLVDQLDRYDPRPAAWAAQPTTLALAARGAAIRDAQRAATGAAAKEEQRVAFRLFARKTYADATDARVAAALDAPAPFVERLVHFWSNHFAVSADKIAETSMVGCFEAEAIRPHVLGRFSDLLLAAERHPTMQMFLDQPSSLGPNSAIGRARAARDPDRKFGINENLAREVMELHTLGVRTGYTQADVTEFARALTGWSVGGGHGRAGQAEAEGAGPDAAVPGAFVWRPALHEPGPRTIRGKVYAQEGEAQPLAVLADLAADPATAHHVATKLARHFIADDPPPAAVARLQAAFLSSGGDLPTVYRALVAAPEAWSPAAAKFKTPWDWQVSLLRGSGVRALSGMPQLQVSNLLGQPVWRPQSPAGYDDVAATWAAPDALVRRVEYAQRFAGELGDRVDARALGGRILPGALSPATATALARADTGATALALLFVSPDFQRR